MLAQAVEMLDVIFYTRCSRNAETNPGDPTIIPPVVLPWWVMPVALVM